MELPEYCFCGCRRHLGKFNGANMEGFTVTFELGHWITYLSLTQHVEPDHDFSEVERFMAEGSSCTGSLPTRRTERASGIAGPAG